MEKNNLDIRFLYTSVKGGDEHLRRIGVEMELKRIQLGRTEEDQEPHQEVFTAPADK